MMLDEILDRVNCCACGGPLDALNLVQLDYKATWKYPTCGYLLLGIDNLAMAVICESCRTSKSPILNAVEFTGEDGLDVVYHPLEDLERVDPIPTFRLVEGPGIECLICGLTSYHPEDVSQKYCGRCHRFHED
jgi:hypothetical protein